MILLIPIERATRLLSASNYPTHGDIQVIFLGIQAHLARYMNNEEFSEHLMADAIYRKLDEYWSFMNNSSQISAVLDPRTKLSVFSTEEQKNDVKNSIIHLTEYFTSTSSTSTTIMTDELTDTRNFFKMLCANSPSSLSVAAITSPAITLSATSAATPSAATTFATTTFAATTFAAATTTSAAAATTSAAFAAATTTSATTATISAAATTTSAAAATTITHNNIANELEKYLLGGTENNIDPLLWWKTQMKEYPILSQIARDYLSIQATSVASEQAFSVAGHTLTAMRNRLHPETARATLCVKSWIHNDIC